MENLYSKLTGTDADFAHGDWQETLMDEVAPSKPEREVEMPPEEAKAFIEALRQLDPHFSVDSPTLREAEKELEFK